MNTIIIIVADVLGLIVLFTASFTLGKNPQNEVKSQNYQSW
jgi:hypothetical protein